MSRRKRTLPELSDLEKLQQLYWRCFHTPEGEAALNDLEQQYQMQLTVTFDRNGRIDREAMSFNEGARSVYLRIINFMDAWEKRSKEKENAGGNEGNTEFDPFTA